MRELEREALRVAREIEGQDTQDLHAAEERGMQPYENFDIDEETRYFSVYRGEVVDDSGYNEDEDILLDSRNTDIWRFSRLCAEEFNRLDQWKRQQWGSGAVKLFICGTSSLLSHYSDHSRPGLVGLVSEVLYELFGWGYRPVGHLCRCHK